MRVNGVRAIGKKPYKWVKSRALLIGLHCMGGKNNLCVSRMVNGLQRTSQGLCSCGGSITGGGGGQRGPNIEMVQQCHGRPI